jgi:hypothetical protein
MRGAGEACKRIHHHLVHYAKAYCLAASTVTPWDPKNKLLPLRTATSSRITSHCLLIILLAHEERERRKGEKSKRLGIELS